MWSICFIQKQTLNTKISSQIIFTTCHIKFRHCKKDSIEQSKTHTDRSVCLEFMQTLMLRKCLWSQNLRRFTTSKDADPDLKTREDHRVYIGWEDRWCYRLSGATDTFFRQSGLSGKKNPFQEGGGGRRTKRRSRRRRKGTVTTVTRASRNNGWWPIAFSRRNRDTSRRTRNR